MNLSQLDIPIDKITQLYFYGAGCGSTEKSDIMKTLLQSVFSCADNIFTLIYWLLLVHCCIKMKVLLVF